MMGWNFWGTPEVETEVIDCKKCCGEGKVEVEVFPDLIPCAIGEDRSIPEIEESTLGNHTISHGFSLAKTMFSTFIITAATKRQLISSWNSLMLLITEKRLTRDCVSIELDGLEKENAELKMIVLHHSKMLDNAKHASFVTRLKFLLFARPGTNLFVDDKEK